MCLSRVPIVRVTVGLPFVRFPRVDLSVVYVGRAFSYYLPLVLYLASLGRHDVSPRSPYEPPLCLLMQTPLLRPVGK